MKRKIDNKTLDQIARRLFVPPAESGQDQIERIVANPDLFSGVMKKVAESGKPSKVRVSILTPWKAASAVGSFAVVALAIVWGVRYQQPPSYTAENAKPTKATFSKNPDIADPEIARPGNPPQPITGKTSAGRATKDSFRIEKAVVRNTEPKRVPSRTAAVQSDEFQSVSYTGDPLETAGGGHVVRVELKRSALFALGVDLPLENGQDTVKADLLVGRDGVTRAVRVVE